MPKIRFLLLLLILFHVSQITGQPIDYARRIVDTLTGLEMRGRGYVDSGDRKAADFIRNEFIRFGLKPSAPDYFQDFPIRINTFPGKIQVQLDTVKLIPGVHFLVDGTSPSISGSFDISTSINNAKDSSFLMVHEDSVNRIDLQKLQQAVNGEYTGIIWVTSSKMNWSLANETAEVPTIWVADSIIANPISINLDIESTYHSRHITQNVMGFIPGSQSDSMVALVAHYDHLGAMGNQVYFPGANDNASGVAMMLSLAEYYSKKPPKYTIIFIAFGAEELGLLGSQYFVHYPPLDLRRIKFAINFDLAGTGEEGIDIVNGSVYKDRYNTLVRINKKHQLLPSINPRGKACNSDHCVFDAIQVPSFFIYTKGGIQAYHDIFDRGETLPLTEFADYFQLMIRFMDQL